MRKKFFTILCLICALLFVSSCGKNTVTEDTQKPFYDGEDDRGVRLVLKHKPMRIVSASLSTDEIILNLVEPERIRAVSWYSHEDLITFIAEKAKKFPRQQYNVEAIMKHEPDLVLVSGGESTPAEFIKTLREVRLPVFVSNNPSTIEEVFKRIERLGKVVGEEDKAAKIIFETRESLKRTDEVVSKIPDEERPVIMAYGYTGAFGRKGGLFDEVTRRAGLKNGAAMLGKDKTTQVSKEQIVALNPDIIFLPTWEHESDEAQKFADSLRSDPAYKNVKAIKNDRLLSVSDRYRYSASHYAVLGAEHMARIVFPEYFKN